MGELLKSLIEFGDNTYIVIDSPPIMATSEPDLTLQIGRWNHSRGDGRPDSKGIH